MTIDASSIASPTHMNFAATAPTKGEKVLAGMLSKAFIADAAALVSPAYAGLVRTDLAELKAVLLKPYPIAEERQIVASYLAPLAEAGLSSPYDYTAGKALAKMITTADANAIYGLLPAGAITKTAFTADIGILKNDLATGKGFSELSQIF